MKTFTYSFRSILVSNVEKNVPGTGRLTLELEMDEKTIEQHTLELSLNDIIHDRSWTINFFLSLMITGGISGMIFGIVYVTSGRTIGESDWSVFIRLFISTAACILILLWIFLSVRNSISNKKREYVEKTRGKGNWRIVDDSEWDNFYRLLTISKKKK